MQKIVVYQFEKYDVNNDGFVKSRRWGTKEAIEKIVKGEVLEHTAIEVDVSEVEASDIPGLTKIGFRPVKRTGFQHSLG